MSQTTNSDKKMRTEKPEKFDANRRQLLRASLVGGAGIIGAASLGTSLSSAAFAAPANFATCTTTPKQTKGPFYPINDQLDKDNDLTVVAGSTASPIGQVIYISGTVMGTDCKPVAGALVEIWQACASGKYNHPNDPNTAALDPHFQYFGKNVTDSQGNYIFKTIIPGAYPADENWDRPPHIHYRVVKLGYAELITQLYFADQPLNKKDLILQALKPEEQAAVTTELKPAPPETHGPRTQIGIFNLTLKKIVP